MSDEQIEMAWKIYRLRRASSDAQSKCHIRWFDDRAWARACASAIAGVRV